MPLSAFTHHQTAEYGYVKIEGHPVYLSPEVQARPAEMNRALTKLTRDLATIHPLLPPAALAALKDIAIWIETGNPDPAGAAVYHPSAQWLREHGYNADKAGAIEISHLRHYLEWERDQPFMLLHEMAHAYHHQVLGYDNAVVKWAFQQAVAARTYEAVRHVRGAKQRAYALNNEQEYFAEITEAYFGKNDFFPFNASQLKQFDAAGHQALERLWWGR